MARLQLKPLEPWATDAVDAINEIFTWREFASNKIMTIDQRIMKLEDRNKLRQNQSRSWPA